MSAFGLRIFRAAGTISALYMFFGRPAFGSRLLLTLLESNNLMPGEAPGFCRPFGYTGL